MSICNTKLYTVGRIDLLNVSHNKNLLASDTLSPTHLTNLAQYIIPEEKIVIEETVGQGYKLHLMKLNVMYSCCV